MCLHFFTKAQHVRQYHWDSAFADERNRAMNAPAALNRLLKTYLL